MTARAAQKIPTLAEAIELIACNDNEGSDTALDPRQVARSITVGIVADLFGIEQGALARQIVRFRKSHS